MEMFKVNATQVFGQFELPDMEGSLLRLEMLSLAFNILCLTGLMYACYWIYYIPWNWEKDLTAVGFNHSGLRKLKKNDCRKRDEINRIRKLRKTLSRDMPPPYPNGWYVVAESSEVEAGQAINVSCLGEQFVVYRTEKNEVHVLDAYCPHMGANLGIGGKVIGDNIQCPFHQWSFRGTDGQCVNVPYSSCAPPLSAKIKKWTSIETNDFIFIWYNTESETPWTLPIVDEIETKKFIYHGRNEFMVNCHIQDIPENGADLAHFAAVHNASFLAGCDPEDKLAASIGSHHWQAVWTPCDGDSKHIAAVSLTHSIELFKNIHMCSMNVKAEQIGPSFVRLFMDTMLGPAVILQVVIPVEPMLQKVIHRFYAQRSAAPFMKFLIWGESVMFERDMKIWNHKTFTSAPCLVKEDRAIKIYRNWYSQFYGENSKSFTQAKETFDW